MIKMVRSSRTPSPGRRGEEGDAAASVGVPVGDGVPDGLGKGVIVTGPGVSVGVAGGVTSRSSFCSGRMTEALFSPFQVIRSASGTAYQPAIHDRVSPPWTTC